MVVENALEDFGELTAGSLEMYTGLKREDMFLGRDRRRRRDIRAVDYLYLILFENARLKVQQDSECL